MKVLFIDDEPLIREGLKSIIDWNSLGFTEFYEAYDTCSGFDVIMSEQPELVILDICMEKESGIDLAKKVRMNDFTRRIIILSGYSDFSYAKSAIDSDVSAYLLKPVDPDELIEVVQKALDELHKENVLSIYYNQPAQLQKNYILHQIVTGRLQLTKDLAESFGLEMNSNYYRLIQLDQVEETISNSLTEFIKQFKRFFIMATITESEHILILTSSSQFSTFRSIFNEYFEMNPEEKKSLIAICSNIDKSSSNIPVLYQDTTNILKKLFYYKSNTNLIDIIQIKSSLAALPNDLNIITLINDIISYIYQLNYAGVKESFLNLHYFLLSKQPPQDTIGYMLSNCYMQILTSLSSKYAFIESELPTVNEFTAHLCTEPYLFDHFEYITKQFSKAINSIKTNDKQNPCDKICKYIEVNASEPLKLETIAELFGYNSAYLGKLFYKETGTHFNTYLNQIRINHAKSYLQKGLSISQTCKKSGFTDTDYFTKKFKKYVGMLPSAFRKQNQ